MIEVEVVAVVARERALRINDDEDLSLQLFNTRVCVLSSYDITLTLVVT